MDHADYLEIWFFEASLKVETGRSEWGLLSEFTSLLLSAVSSYFRVSNSLGLPKRPPWRICSDFFYPSIIASSRFCCLFEGNTISVSLRDLSILLSVLKYLFRIATFCWLTEHLLKESSAFWIVRILAGTFLLLYYYRLSLYERFAIYQSILPRRIKFYGSTISLKFVKKFILSLALIVFIRLNNRSSWNMKSELVIASLSLEWEKLFNSIS